MACRHGWSRTAILFGVALVAVLVVGSGGVVGELPADPETDRMDESPTVGAGPIHLRPGSTLLQSESLANSSNSSPQLPPPHRNPAAVESSSSSAQLEALLRGSIDQDLASSIENLDEGDYELAREQLGEDFEAELRRYAESADEFDAEEQAELFASLESEQEAYIDAVERYDTTRAAYESARESGETARNRELGRELVTAAERVSTTGDRVIDTYRELGNRTDQEFSTRTARIQQRRENASETATTVRAEFTETSLSVTANRSTVAFTDPIRLSGTVRTTDGSSVDPHRAVIDVANRRYTVAVGSDGGFEVVVEPDGVWMATDGLDVSYRPTNSSTLLESSTTVPLSVAETETRIGIDSTSETASYDSPLMINGTLSTAAGEPVPAAPISIRAAGAELATTETTSDGRFSVDATLPATLPAGETDLVARLTPSSRALAGSETDTTVQLVATDPVLSVNATPVEGGDATPRVSVDGQLTSPDGRPVSDASVTVFVAGEAVGELSTDSEGVFGEEFRLPEGTASGTEITVGATYEPPESNLDPARGSTTVVLPETLLESVGLSSDAAIPLGIGAGVGLVGVLGGAGWWLRRTPDRQEGATDTGQPSSLGRDGIGDEELLATATTRLDAGDHETAALVAYIAARREFGETVSVPETATHWEWYQACAAAGVDRLSELETLVEAFEQVVFAPDTAEQSAAASRAVDTARQLCAPEQ